MSSSLRSRKTFGICHASSGPTRDAEKWLARKRFQSSAEKSKGRIAGAGFPQGAGSLCGQCTSLGIPRPIAPSAACRHSAISWPGLGTAATGLAWCGCRREMEESSLRPTPGTTTLGDLVLRHHQVEAVEPGFGWPVEMHLAEYRGLISGLLELPGTGGLVRPPVESQAP